MGLSEQELGDHREIFGLVDTDGTGAIDRDELQRLMHMVGMKISEEQMEVAHAGRRARAALREPAASPSPDPPPPPPQPVHPHARLGFARGRSTSTARAKSSSTSSSR